MTGLHQWSCNNTTSNDKQHIRKAPFPVKGSGVKMKLFAILHFLLKASLFKAVIFVMVGLTLDLTRMLFNKKTKLFIQPQSLPGDADNPK